MASTDLSYTPKSEYMPKNHGTQATSSSGGSIFPVDPTKGEMKDIMMLVYFMTMMGDTYKKNLPGLKDGMDTYIFDQNLKNANSIGDVFQTCVRYLTQNNPEAEKIVDRLNKALKALGECYQDPLTTVLKQVFLIDGINDMLAHLNQIAEGAKSQPHSAATHFAVGIVKEYGEDALNVLVGTDKIDPSKAPYNAQIATTQAGQQQDAIKQRLESVKTIAQNMQQMEKTLEGLMKVVTSSNDN